jgi:hypothetical protein
MQCFAALGVFMLLRPISDGLRIGQGSVLITHLIRIGHGLKFV